MSLIEIGSRLVDDLPDSHEAITDIITQRLRSIGSYGNPPTDLEAVIGDGGMSLLEPDEGKVSTFLSRLDEDSRREFKRMRNKFRGAFGFRDRTIYVPEMDRDVYRVFPTAHEATHGLLPWHDTSFLDDCTTLSAEFENLREREANFGGSQLIFQGNSFCDRVMEGHESLDSALGIADEYGATAASTFWRYTQVHDRPVALLVYGKRRRLVRAVASTRFRKKWSAMLVPDTMGAEHEWNKSPSVLNLARTTEGDLHLTSNGERYRVEWQTWRNRYAVYVLVVMPSRLHSIGGLLRDFKSLVGS